MAEAKTKIDLKVTPELQALVDRVERLHKHPRTGYLTTEFWLTVAMVLASVYLYKQGAEGSAKSLAILVVSAYAISRGIAKRQR